MSTIRDLERKVRTNKSLSEDELSDARRLLFSSELSERVLAYEVLLHGSSPAARLELIPLIERECAQVRQTKSKYPCNLLLVLRRIPTEILKSSEVFRQFVFAAAWEGSTGSRANSMYILGKLAAQNDQTALETLTAALSDKHEYVRLNASTAMKRIGRASPTCNGSR